MNTNLINRMLIIGLIFALVICSVVLAYYYQPVIIEGVVDHKTIVGIRDDAGMTIIRITPHGVIVKDKELKSHLINLKKFTLDEVIEFLQLKYDAIYCTVSIRVITSDPLNNLAPGETLAYIIDVKYFDMLKIGSKVKFTITRLNPLKINEVIEVKQP